MHSLPQLLNSAILAWKWTQTIGNEWAWLCSNKALFTNWAVGQIWPMQYDLPTPAADDWKSSSGRPVYSTDKEHRLLLVRRDPGKEHGALHSSKSSAVNQGFSTSAPRSASRLPVLPRVSCWGQRDVLFPHLPFGSWHHQLLLQPLADFCPPQTSVTTYYPPCHLAVHQALPWVTVLSTWCYFPSLPSEVLSLQLNCQAQVVSWKATARGQMRFLLA